LCDSHPRSTHAPKRVRERKSVCVCVCVCVWERERERERERESLCMHACMCVWERESVCVCVFASVHACVYACVCWNKHSTGMTQHTSSFLSTLKQMMQSSNNPHKHSQLICSDDFTISDMTKPLAQHATHQFDVQPQHAAQHRTLTRQHNRTYDTSQICNTPWQWTVPYMSLTPSNHVSHGKMSMAHSHDGSQNAHWTCHNHNGS